MKKAFAVIAAVCFVSNMVIPAFAETAQHKKQAAAVPGIEVTHGSIVSVDTVKKEIVVKDEKTGKDKAFTVSEKAVAAVKVGDKVKVKAKEGSNAAENVKVVNLEPKKK
jgi:hypothetical protein